MTGSPFTPEQPKRYSWDSEETLVQQRKKLRYRIARFFSGNWFLLLVLIALFVILRDAQVTRTALNFIGAVSPLILRLVITATLAIGQFALIFWFLGKARTYTIYPGTEGVSFKDYRGQPELLDQAKQIVQLLRGVKVFEEAGGEPLNGLLLEGPPGTGKTWLAQAISTEAGVPFFYVDASSLNSMFMGIAPLKVSNLYSKARRAAKEYGASVIFIDEIDAIGSRMGVASVDKEDRYEPADTPWTRLPMFFGMGAGSGLLSVMLIEMSGFSLEHGWWANKKRWFYKTFLRRSPPKPAKRVLTIGATNRMGALDPALLRPGRFDKKIRVDVPDLEGRRDILAYYLSKMSHDETIDPLVLSSETPFYTPSALKYLLNEGLRYALFDDRTVMNITDIRKAQPEHEYGLRMPIKNMTLEDKRRLCAHEAGHALAVRLFRPHYRISRITVIRQGAALGYVQSYPALEEDQMIAHMTVDSLETQLLVAVGGRAGELEFCGTGEMTLGVGGDFHNVRSVLHRMAEAGLFGQLQFVVERRARRPGKSPDQRVMPQPQDAHIIERMEETFRMALDEVRMAMRLHHDMGEALIKLLMEKDELMANEVEEFFDRYGLHTPKVSLPGQLSEVIDLETPRRAASSS